jgi:hypothetical protein
VNFREGMRRLAIVLGLLGIPVGMLVGYAFSEDVHRTGLGVTVGAMVGFVIAWGCVRVIGWIIDGFSKGRYDSPR